MKQDRERRTNESPRAEAPTTPAAKRAWTRPDYTEVAALAEIGAYAFRAG